MSRVLAVDPGIRGCGAAVFEEGRLVRAAYVRSPMKTGNTAAASAAMGIATADWLAGSADEVALEWPRVYATMIRLGKSKGDPNDLLALAGVDGALTARIGASATCYAPSDWKGQMPKEACAARVRSRLDAAEAVVLLACGAPPSLLHNVLDAIGIGLHHLGRLGVRRAA